MYIIEICHRDPVLFYRVRLLPTMEMGMRGMRSMRVVTVVVDEALRYMARYDSLSGV